MRYTRLSTSIFFLLLVIGISTQAAVRVTNIPAGMSQAFAVETDKGLFLIDAGSPGEEKNILKKLSAFSNKPLNFIIITHAHFDHYGSAKAIRSLTGAKIAIDKKDSSAMANGSTPIPLTKGIGTLGKLFLPVAEFILKPQPTVADIILFDNERLDSLGLAATVIETPGHTIGSISILCDDGMAFTGDLLVSAPWFKLQCYYANDWGMLAKSLARIKTLKPSRIFSGHAARPFSLAQLLKLTPVNR